MKKLLTILTILTALIFVGCNNEKRDAAVIKNLPVAVPQTFPVAIDRADTPYISSVVPVPEAAIEAITSGLQMQIRATSLKFPAWQNGRKVSDYNVMLIEPTATNLDGSPALTVYGIQTAGTVIGLPGDEVSPPNIILPHQENSDWKYLNYLRDSARNESEHYAELINDISVFNQFTGPNDVHPHHLLPEENQLRGLKSSPNKNFVCGLSVK